MSVTNETQLGTKAKQAIVPSGYMTELLSRNDLIDMISDISGSSSATMNKKLINIALTVILNDASKLAVNGGNGVQDMKITKDHIKSVIENHFNS